MQIPTADSRSYWLLPARCLDIGCNDGTFTRQIASRFAPAYMLGIDIDARLIDAAWRQGSEPPLQASGGPSEATTDGGVRPLLCWRREDITVRFPLSWQQCFS
jgi:SAM-dependent methyltransferase